MNQKLKYLLIAVAVILIAAVLVWKFVNKPTTDYAGQKPEMSYSFAELMKKIETDTSNMKDKLIAVNGNITKITSKKTPMKFVK